MISGNQVWFCSMKAMMLSANACTTIPWPGFFWPGYPIKAREMRSHQAPVNAA
jgi:hypothetical protein